MEDIKTIDVLALPRAKKVQDGDTELDMNIDALCALYDEVK